MSARTQWYSEIWRLSRRRRRRSGSCREGLRSSSLSHGINLRSGGLRRSSSLEFGSRCPCCSSCGRSSRCRHSRRHSRFAATTAAAAVLVVVVIVIVVIAVAARCVRVTRSATTAARVVKAMRVAPLTAVVVVHTAPIVAARAEVACTIVALEVVVLSTVTALAESNAERGCGSASWLSRSARDCNRKPTRRGGCGEKKL